MALPRARSPWSNVFKMQWEMTNEISCPAQLGKASEGGGEKTPFQANAWQVRHLQILLEEDAGKCIWFGRKQRQESRG